MKFDRAKPETQAKKAMKVIVAKGLCLSVGTNRNYAACLAHVTQFVQENKLGDLRQISRETSEAFLHSKRELYSQKTLDMHRQALQMHLEAQGRLNHGEKLEIVKSAIKTKLEHRAYTSKQVSLVANAQNDRNAFSTILAHSCGLRAHELLTLRPLQDQPATERHYEDGSLKSLPSKWEGREVGVPYSVVGKGGLIREVRVPVELAKKLEEKRLETPLRVRDRNVFYTSYYDVAGGKAWSNSFSAASTRALGWSTGAHGLRHSYAQERMRELQKFVTYEVALETVSQEMGHFREEITEVYLR